MNRTNEQVNHSNPSPLPFRLLGGWIEQPSDLQPKLEGSMTADVIVVGAGFAGPAMSGDWAEGLRTLLAPRRAAGHRRSR